MLRTVSSNVQRKLGAKHACSRCSVRFNLYRMLQKPREYVVSALLFYLRAHVWEVKYFTGLGRNGCIAVNES